MDQLLCIDDVFLPLDEAHFKFHGIIKPVRDHIYTIRQIVKHSKGGYGLLLNEIVNKPTPKLSPLTDMPGIAEQTWSVKRFRTLMGDDLTEEMLKEELKAQKTEKIIVNPLKKEEDGNI